MRRAAAYPAGALRRGHGEREQCRLGERARAEHRTQQKPLSHG